MAGKLCNGGTLASGDTRRSRAYCEGMAYRQSGTAAGKPKTDNPHTDTSSKDHVAWDAGWDVADGEAGGTLSASECGCCALRGLSVSA